jgi:hypothetical protein
MTSPRRLPTRLAGGASVGAALVALAASGRYAWPAFVVGTVGLALLVLGLVRGERGPLTLGAAGLAAGGIVAGARGAPVGPTLAGVTFAVLAWDAGGTAVSLGDQLGRDAETARLEAVHLAGSAAVAAVTAAVGYGVYRAATGGRPVAALLLLLLAAVLLLATLD